MVTESEKKALHKLADELWEIAKTSPRLTWDEQSKLKTASSYLHDLAERK